MQFKISAKAKEENYIELSAFYLMHCICGAVVAAGRILAVELLPKPQKGCATK